MNWYVKEQEYTHTLKDSKGNAWGYITEKELMKQYPNGGYRIVADLRKRANASEDILLIGEEMETGIYPYRRKKKRLEKTAGYINVSSEEYPDSFVCVRKSNLFQGLILPLLVLLILCAVFVIGWWLSRKEYVPGLDDTAVSYRIEGMQNTDPESIAVPGVSRIEVKAGETEVDFPLINPEGNTCYMKYIIRDAQTEEVLYESGKIKPGMAVMKFDLNRTLDPGTYNILVEIKTSDLNDHEVELNGAEIPAELVVE